MSKIKKSDIILAFKGKNKYSKQDFNNITKGIQNKWFYTLIITPKGYKVFEEDSLEKLNEKLKKVPNGNIILDVKGFEEAYKYYVNRVLTSKSATKDNFIDGIYRYIINIEQTNTSKKSDYYLSIISEDALKVINDYLESCKVSRKSAFKNSFKDIDKEKIEFKNIRAEFDKKAREALENGNEEQAREYRFSALNYVEPGHSKNSRYPKYVYELCDNYRVDNSSLDKYLEKSLTKDRKDLLNKLKPMLDKVVGVSNVVVGKNGSLEGVFKGSNGKTVKLDSTYAGGYNIQSLHIRTYVKYIK